MDKYSDLEGNEETQDNVLEILLREIPQMNDYIKLKSNNYNQTTESNGDWTIVTKNKKKKKY